MQCEVLALAFLYIESARSNLSPSHWFQIDSTVPDIALPKVVDSNHSFWFYYIIIILLSVPGIYFHDSWLFIWSFQIATAHRADQMREQHLGATTPFLQPNMTSHPAAFCELAQWSPDNILPFSDAWSEMVVPFYDEQNIIFGCEQNQTKLHDTTPWCFTTNSTCDRFNSSFSIYYENTHRRGSDASSSSSSTSPVDLLSNFSPLSQQPCSILSSWSSSDESECSWNTDPDVKIPPPPPPSYVEHMTRIGNQVEPGWTGFPDGSFRSDTPNYCSWMETMDLADCEERCKSESSIYPDSKYDVQSGLNQFGLNDKNNATTSVFTILQGIDFSI